MPKYPAFFGRQKLFLCTLFHVIWKPNEWQNSRWNLSPACHAEHFWHSSLSVSLGHGRIECHNLSVANCYATVECRDGMGLHEAG